MEKEKDIDQYVVDAIMGRPYGFSVKDKHFYLYPLTLGKRFLLSRQISNLEIQPENIKRDLSLEAIRLAKEKREECLSIICYYTCKTQDEVFDALLIADRKKLFDEELSDDDIAALMIATLSADKTDLFMEHLGINKEQERLNAAMRVKKKGDKNNLVFCGKTQFGTLIDSACERYGWTKEYVVWGIDYTSLRLMLADKVVTMYCSDEEMRKMPASVKHGNDEVIKSTKENMEKILKMDWR